MLCVLLIIAILGGVWMLSARVTSAQIYAALEELPVTNKTSEISAYLDRYFIDDYDEQALADAAAAAMVDSNRRPLELLSQRGGLCRPTKRV